MTNGCSGIRPSIPKAHPGRPVLIEQAPQPTRRIALTIDDGYDPATVAGYVQLCVNTGLHLTFSPNGVMYETWERHREALRPLIERGQIQIGNHTFHHRSLTRIPASAAREEVERNEDWIQRTFGVTSRPYLRPPYGDRDDHTDALCGGLGFTRILMWNESFDDAMPTSQPALLAAARRSLREGAIVLGHANHATVTQLYGEILELIRLRNLQASTLDEIFGTSRSVG